MRIVSKLFSVPLLLCGCVLPPMPGGRSKSAMCGGTTDLTDINAPKTIYSKDIVKFSANFFAYDKYDTSKGGVFLIKIAGNEKGESVLSVNGVYRHSTVVDSSVLDGVQAIIDKYRLARNNGVSRVTAGLPSQYDPCGLSVVYASGEELSFYMNGSPDMNWAQEMRDYFLGVLTRAGFEDVLPPKEAVTIKKFTFRFDRDGYSHQYCPMLFTQEGITRLWHGVWDFDTQQEKLSEFAAITDELFSGLQALLVATSMESLRPCAPANLEVKPGKEGFLYVCIDYESGRQIYGKYESAQLPESWGEIKKALTEFFDNYFRENAVQV